MIRYMNKDDVLSLSKVYYQTRAETFDWMSSNEININDFTRDTKGEKIWVAEINRQVVGFISVFASDNFIHHLFVLPEHSGQNIGSQLLSVCLKNIGRPATLKCVSANTNALRFYKSKGWRTVSVGVSEGNKYQLMTFNSSQA